MTKLCLITNIGLAEEEKVTVKEVGTEKPFTIYPDIETMKALILLIENSPEEPIIVELNEENEVLLNGEL